MNGGSSPGDPIELGTVYNVGASGQGFGGSSIRDSLVIYVLLFLFLGVPLLRAIDKAKR